VRVAAVEALAEIADGDMLADGGARGTAQALALALQDDTHLDSVRLHAAAHATLIALMHPEGSGGPVAGGKYWG
jgi:hypothetical protein